ncbi:hypothetical protein AD936_03250, partial [Gluconobacter japonicus]
APWRMLDSEGALVMPPEAARSIHGNDLSKTSISVTHPPGLYGPAHGTRALNVSNHSAPLNEEPLLGTRITPDGGHPDRPIGPWLLAAGLLVLLVDFALSLRRRGLLGPIAAILVLITMPQAQAQAAIAPPALPASAPPAALETRLAYVLTGHDDVDEASKQGLQGLSDYTSARSSAALGHPDGVTPGKDDLAFYPMLYWPITADAQPDAARTKALNAFMDHGGILLIDQQGAGTDMDAGSGGAVRAALKRVTDGLIIPPLAKLTDKHVLGHTFYLLHSGFPGRING